MNGKDVSSKGPLVYQTESKSRANNTKVAIYTRHLFVLDLLRNMPIAQSLLFTGLYGRLEESAVCN